jgi:hypothetical protein
MISVEFSWGRFLSTTAYRKGLNQRGIMYYYIGDVALEGAKMAMEGNTWPWKVPKWPWFGADTWPRRLDQDLATLFSTFCSVFQREIIVLKTDNKF